MWQELYALIDDPGRVLVTPTERSRRALLNGYVRSRRKAVPASRVVSFDDFSELFQEDPGDRRRANQIVRGAFAGSFLAKEGGKLSYLYDASTCDTSRFTSYIASILPSLKEGRGEPRDPRLASDIAVLASAYSSFLSEKGWYEPRWMKKSSGLFRGDRNLKWTLVCPSTEPNMLRLLETIGDCPFVETFEPKAEPRNVCLEYENERAEILALFDELEILRSKGVDEQDIILSTPDTSRLRARLEDEAWRRGMRLSFEMEGPALSTRAGKWLKGIRELGESSFDFASLERVLLDESLPWLPEKLELNKRLVRLMVDRSLTDDIPGDLRRNLWEGRDEGAVANHFSTIKGFVNGTLRARSAREAERSFQGLADHLFGPGQFGSGEDWRSYSWMMDQWSSFASVFESLGGGPGSFGLFLSVMEGAVYTPQDREPGIMVMQYGHDQTISAEHRFLFALGDENTKREVSEWDFLEDYEAPPEGRRTIDSTDSLLALYASFPGNVRLSRSRKTYAGPSSPPFLLSSLGLVRKAPEPPSGRKPSREALRSALVSEGRAEPPSAADDLASEFKVPREAPVKGFSYTRISNWAKCPFREAARLLLHADDSLKWSPSDLDNFRLGNALHAVIEKFLTAHRGEWLQPSDSEKLGGEIRAVFDDVFSNDPRYSFSSYARAYVEANHLKGLMAFPEALSRELDGPFRPLEAEGEVSGAGLNGRIDASFISDDSLVLVDFKTGSSPTKKRYQLMLYRKLLSETGKGDVGWGNLFYYLFKTGEAEAEIKGKGLAQKAAAEEREAEMEEDIAATREGWKEGVWKATPGEESCSYCSYRTVCRRRYATR